MVAATASIEVRVLKNPGLDEADRRVLHQFCVLDGDLKAFQQWWGAEFPTILDFFRRPEIKEELDEFLALRSVTTALKLRRALDVAIDELVRVMNACPSEDLTTGRHAANSLIRLARQSAQRTRAEHPDAASSVPQTSPRPSSSPDASMPRASMPSSSTAPIPPRDYRAVRTNEPTSLDDLAVYELGADRPVARYKPTKTPDPPDLPDVPRRQDGKHAENGAEQQTTEDEPQYFETNDLEEPPAGSPDTQRRFESPFFQPEGQREESQGFSESASDTLGTQPSEPAPHRGARSVRGFNGTTQPDSVPFSENQPGSLPLDILFATPLVSIIDLIPSRTPVLSLLSKAGRADLPPPGWRPDFSSG